MIPVPDCRRGSCAWWGRRRRRGSPGPAPSPGSSAPPAATEVMLLASFFLSTVLRIRDFEKRKRNHGCGSATLTRTRSSPTRLSEPEDRIIYVRLSLMFYPGASKSVLGACRKERTEVPMLQRALPFLFTYTSRTKDLLLWCAWCREGGLGARGGGS